MRILVCGNQAEHEWPEACVRALERLGHDARLVHYRSLREGDLEEHVPAKLWPSVPDLLEHPDGRKSLLELVFYNAAATFRPDLVLLAGIYNTWSSDALADVTEELGVPVVLWAGDDPWAPHAPDVFSRAAFYDLVLFGNWRFVERAGDDFAATAYMPFGCDPVRDRPPGPEADLEPYRCDLSFLGTLKGKRCEFLDGLARQPFDTKVWGAKWPRDLERSYPALAAARQPEHVQGAAKARVYGGSKVVLNLHHTGFANMKLYEAAACGAFQISNKRLEAEATRHVLDLCDEVVTYEHPAELLALVEHYLAHPEQRRARAEKLRDLVLARHTWDARLAAVLELALPETSPIAIS